ncbi:MAG TPA: molybdopterin-dependent oxidoreductase, partial [Candidatus Nitrosotenuis sp.]|nr:molybdopterin-dependent oxidoreductase [Candidatus Nitrosotenuis sp.]
DALAALAGNLGVPGGGVSYYFRRRGAFDTSLVRGLEVAPRSFSEARLGPELLAADPPVRAIWVTAANPVSMLPDSEAVAKAFRRAELVVVVDTHPTDTTDCAHLVLPTLTLLEDDDLLGAYGNHYLRASSPALAPPGQARHELSILQDLAARLGLGDRLAGSVADWKRRFLAPVEDQGVTLEALARGAVRNPRAPRVLFEGGRFPTPSGKMRLLTEPPPPPPRRTPRFPLALMASSTPWAQASQWSVPAPWPPEARVHPASAAGLAHGEVAWVQTARGRMQVRLLHDPDVHPEVLLLAKGGMLRQGGCANRLIEARETDHGGGAAYYEEPCCLMPLASPAPGS